MTSWQSWTWMCPLWFDWPDQASLCMRAAWSHVKSRGRTLRGSHDLAPGHVTRHTARCCGFPPRDSRLKFKITSYAPHWLWLLMMMVLKWLIARRWGLCCCCENVGDAAMLSRDVVTCDDAESWQLCVINQWLVITQHFYPHLSVSNN